MPKNRDDSSPEAPSFVFIGTVRKLRAATLAGLPTDDRTAIVHVDQVIEAAPAFMHAAGTDITVQLAGRSKVAVGAKLVVHAVAWTFGDGIAVRALSQETPKPMHAQLAARAGDPTQHKANRDLQQRVADADLVVSGKVA